MSQPNIIRAWKDEEYRRSLSEAERALLPGHPAGLVELTEADMSRIDGGLAGGGCTCCKQILWTAYCSY
jgi:mersacidin/lichenicidin family type 2 lantibiotic